MKKFIAAVVFALVFAAFAIPAFADETAPLVSENAGASQETAAITEEAAQAQTTSSKAWTAAIVLGAVGVAAALGMALTISKASESMARQPEAAGDIRSSTLLGLVFLETAIIYALIVAILIIFVL